jgi:hypothetical protein
MKYRCWGDDGEDLTEKVERAKEESGGDGGVVVFGVKMFEKRASRPYDPRVVMVACSKGHENVFEIGD